jgi:DNA-binding FadR family transcriptional regulator
VEDSTAIERATHETALRLAVRCRRVVQACLREEEWLDADREFFEIIRDGLKDFIRGQIRRGRSHDR